MRFVFAIAEPFFCKRSAFDRPILFTKCTLSVLEDYPQTAAVGRAENCFKRIQLQATQMVNRNYQEGVYIFCSFNQIEGLSPTSFAPCLLLRVVLLIVTWYDREADWSVAGE